MLADSDEMRLEPINDMLNPAPNRFGMPWYVILGILTLCVGVFIIVPGSKLFMTALLPSMLGFGWWLTKDDPKEPQLILHDLCLPSGWDAGK